MADRINIKPEIAADEDKQELKALFDECFPGESGFSKWFFDSIWKSSDTLVVRRANEMVSALQMLPVELEYNGEKACGCYIFAVGTHPRYEGMGYAGALLRESFRLCTDKGLDFSALIVQRSSLINYYTRFGYEPLFKVQRINLDAKEGSGNIIELGREHTHILDRIYRQDKADMLFDARNDLRWHEQMDAYKVLGYEKNGEITSYCFADSRMGIFFAAEACGSDACELVQAAAFAQNKPRCQLLTAPIDNNAEQTGCFMALSDKAKKMRGSAKGFYLNLYYN